MKLGHLTEQRKHFVEAYCRLGNGTLAAREAGYKDSPSLVNQASKLKRELSGEISEELTTNFVNAAPKALSTILDLLQNSASDSVKFQASKDLLDRAGFKPTEKREEISPKRNPEELEAEMVRLVGEVIDERDGFEVCFRWFPTQRKAEEFCRKKIAEG